MPEVQSFRGLRYAASLLPDLGDLLCPPYDAIPPALEERLLARHPLNAVRIELGAGDGPDRHAAAAATLARWRREGTLVPELRPALYVSAIDFESDGRRLERLGVTAVVALAPAGGRGRVLRHERTLAAPKEERLRMLRATRVQSSSVFGLVEDPQGELLSLLDRVRARTPEVDAVDADGSQHRVWIVDDAPLVRGMRELLSARDILIADGHHRYETAERYAEETGAAAGDGPASRVMMQLVRMEDPGLLLRGYHRTVRVAGDVDLESFVASLAGSYEVERADGDGGGADGRLWGALAGARDRAAFAMAVARRGRYLVRARAARDPRAPTEETLDVAVLERDVFARRLGLGPDAIRTGTQVGFHHEPRDAFAAVDGGEAQLAFVLNPIDVRTVARLAAQGTILPQKSTWFTPKVPAGLVFYPVEGEVPA